MLACALLSINYKAGCAALNYPPSCAGHPGYDADVAAGTAGCGGAASSAGRCTADGLRAGRCVQLGGGTCNLPQPLDESGLCEST